MAFQKGHTINKGRLLTEEHKAKIGLWGKGRTHIGVKNGTSFSKGNVPYNAGKKCPEISERQRAEKNHMWKGGITPVNVAVRNSEPYKELRKQALYRDGYTCCECGNERKAGNRVKLEVDHIKPFAHFPKLRFNLSNVRTLCHPCHRKIGWNRWKPLVGQNI